jgi:hypothetical protein
MPTEEEIIKEFELKKKSDWTDEEKVARFDSMYDNALETLQRHLTGEESKDKEEYAWEDVMGLLGPKVWDVWGVRDEDAYDLNVCWKCGERIYKGELCKDCEDHDE